MNIICVSNVDTGSSAFLDFLSEYSSCSYALRTEYEHVVFYAPNSLFHLKDVLFGNNSDQFSNDVALNEFLRVMDHYYRNDFGWFGGYKKLIGESFKKEYLSFVNSISFEQEKSFQFGQYKYCLFSPAKALGQVLLKKKRNVYGLHYVIDKRPCRILSANEEQFFERAKHFIEFYIDACHGKTPNVIFDHLVWLQNLKEWQSYFPSDTKMVYCERDPRDILASYRYVFKSADTYPLEVSAFAKFYKEQRRFLPPNSENFLTLHFEDLVLNYDKTELELEKFLGLSTRDHQRKFEFFNPKKSIANVGIYLRDKRCKDFAEELALLLPNYCYKLTDAQKDLIIKAKGKSF
jgi:hypothetical protein